MSQAVRSLKTLLCASAILAAALATGHAANAADYPNVQPGNWEITISSEMAGMPAGMPAMPPMTVTNCVKPDQIKDAQSVAESMQKRNKGKCKVSDVKFANDKLSYNFACEGGTGGTTEVVYSGTTYEGTTKMTFAGHGNGSMTRTQHFKAKRTGNC